MRAHGRTPGCSSHWGLGPFVTIAGLSLTTVITRGKEEEREANGLGTDWLWRCLRKLGGQGGKGSASGFLWDVNGSLSHRNSHWSSRTGCPKTVGQTESTEGGKGRHIPGSMEQYSKRVWGQQTQKIDERALMRMLQDISLVSKRKQYFEGGGDLSLFRTVLLFDRWEDWGPRGLDGLSQVTLSGYWSWDLGWSLISLVLVASFWFLFSD